MSELADNNACVKAVYVVFGIIWGLCFAAAGVLIVNAQFYVSNCEPSGGPCTDRIVSDQFTSLAWAATSIFSERIFFFFAFIALVGGYGRNKGCGVIWILGKYDCEKITVNNVSQSAHRSAQRKFAPSVFNVINMFLCF